jgi:hypothetical protein
VAMRQFMWMPVGAIAVVAAAAKAIGIKPD